MIALYITLVFMVFWVSYLLILFCCLFWLHLTCVGYVLVVYRFVLVWEVVFSLGVVFTHFTCFAFFGWFAC